MTLDEHIEVPTFGHAEKIVTTFCGTRLSYVRAFQYASTHVAKGALCVLTNADIYWSEEDVRRVAKMPLKDGCLAMSRYDVQHNSTHQIDIAAAPISQDTWVFRSPLSQVGPDFPDFPLGQLGCDNRIAYELRCSGLRVLNPCLSIKLFHLHLSQKRNYTKKDTIPGPYCAVIPCSLNVA